MNKKLSITKQDLEQLYRSNKNKKVCEILRITMPTLVSYLKQHNITLKGCGNREPKAKVVIE